MLICRTFIMEKILQAVLHVKNIAFIYNRIKITFPMAASQG